MLTANHMVCLHLYGTTVCLKEGFKTRFIIIYFFVMKRKLRHQCVTPLGKKRRLQQKKGWRYIEPRFWPRVDMGRKTLLSSAPCSREHDAGLLHLPPAGHVVLLLQSIHLRLPERLLCCRASLPGNQAAAQAAADQRATGNVIYNVMYIYI